MDPTRLLGTLLGGVLVPPRRRTTRRRAPASLIDIRVGGSRRTASALAALAGLAVEALAKSGQGPATPPAPSPRGGRGRSPAPPAPVPPTPAPSPPEAGRRSPWSTTPSPPPPAPAKGSDGSVGAEDREAMLMIRAMIAASRADGTMDADERATIAAQLDAASLEADARDLVLAEFARPASVEALAGEIADPVLAAQVYAACVLAVGDITAPERAWLDRFAALTRLSPEARAAIEKRLAGG